MRRLMCFACAAAAIARVGLSLAAPAAPPARYSGLAWRLIGPFVGGAVTGVRGTTGRPGEYVVTARAGAYATHDGGTTWVASEAGGPTAPRWTDPADPPRIAETDDAGIRVSLDGGTTWTAHHNLPVASVDYTTEADGPSGGGYWIYASIAGRDPIPLPSGPGAGPTRLVPRAAPPVTGPAHPPIDGQAVLTFLTDRNDPNLQLAGTATGVLVSVDAGAQWTSLQLNLPTVAVTDLKLFNNDLIASTDGSSVWILDDISPLRALARGGGTGPIELFPPASITLGEAGRISGRGVDLDYYLAEPSTAPVTLEVLDRTGARLVSLTSAASTDADPWAPIRVPLATSAGGHRVVWNLRTDPPPAPSNRYRQLAPQLFESDLSGAPAGPTLLAGTYQVRLTVGSHVATAPFTIVPMPWSVGLAASGIGPSPAGLSARFALAHQLTEALARADVEARQLRRVRAAVKALTTATNPDVAQAATDLETHLADLDGSDWKFVLPDMDTDNDLDYYDKDLYEEILPVAAAVSLTKDYDDPTTIVGSNFQNSNHPPAFAPIGDDLAALLAKVEAQPGAPPAGLVTDVNEAEGQLTTSRANWQAIVTTALPAFNHLLVTHGLPAIPPPPAAKS